MDVVIIGGGAAGVFAAIHAKTISPSSNVILLEKGSLPLSKVKASGGGRCNLTNACFDPIALSKNYPRGGKELLGPFSKFGSKETIDWFESHGVKIKTEKDGRCFPSTNSSETIVKCLLVEAHSIGVCIKTSQEIIGIEKCSNGFKILLHNHESISAHRLLLATGSSCFGYEWAKKLGHTIIQPIPSLFAFNINHFELKHLSGISLEDVIVTLPEFNISQRGAILITHFGFSGPVILKISSWAAEKLFKKNYETDLYINWYPKLTEEQILYELKKSRSEHANRSIASTNPLFLPKKLWETFVGDDKSKICGLLSKKFCSALAHKISKDLYRLAGRTLNKGEFVTCGGVDTKEVNFKTMESKICEGLFFAGEILNIDGLTGGFNLQNCWTTGYIAGTNL